LERGRLFRISVGVPQGVAPPLETPEKLPCVRRQSAQSRWLWLTDLLTLGNTKAAGISSLTLGHSAAFVGNGDAAENENIVRWRCNYYYVFAIKQL
jgi:hypothetical protein